MQRVGLGKTDTGSVRSKNEDSILVINEKTGHLCNVFAVADGMGGHKAGEIASSSAVASFKAYLEQEREYKHSQDLLTDAVLEANKKVFELSKSDPEFEGMGTTFSACSRDENNVYYAHAGDSRIYLISPDEIKQITTDHTWVNVMVQSGSMTEDEAAAHPHRHMLTRALGTETEISVDYGFVPAADSETVLICSDGLTNMLREGEIMRIVNAHDVITEKELIVDELIAEANKNGGVDNISVILI